MTKQEIVRALRLCADKTERYVECSTGQRDCPFGETIIDCIERMNRSAADLIESLQAKNNSLQNSRDLLREAIKMKGGTEYAPTEDAYLAVCAALEKCRARLAESHRREWAAIEDLRVGWLCRSCVKRVVGKEWRMCNEGEFIAGPERTTTCANFDWRGPHGAGECEQND